MRKKHFLFAALFFAALSLGFVSCENPDDEPGFSLENVGQEDADDKNDANSDGTTPSTPEKPTLIATGDVTDLAENSATFWGRLNADTLWALPNVKWGVEYAYDRETVSQHKHQETTKVNCTAGLQGANMDEFSVTIDGLQRSQTIYYSAYILINDMKYVYGELDSVHIVKLTVESNNSNYGTVTDCSGYYNYGFETTITATPKENYYLTWSDCDSKELTRTVQVNSDTTITAIFSENPYLTAKPNSSDYGTVTGSGYYAVGAEVTITATPKYDYIEFVQWSDGNTENPRTITITTDATYTATFKVDLPDGAFLVNDNGKCVYFSPGNLQYHPANNEWRFAPSQLDYIGEANENISSTYNGWLDLFGWSTSATYFGVSTSTDWENGYSGSFVDWGTNQIGSDAPNTWRTLGIGDWYHLLEFRPNASALKGVAQVNGVNGLILLPDSWICPAGITFKSGFHSKQGSSYYAAYQTFTADEWSKLESAGAVFLPAAGNRNGSDVGGVRIGGCYWHSSSVGYFFADAIFLNSGSAVIGDGGDRYRGQSVRLVKDL